MNRNKICPDCEIEYLPHIEKCADCGAVLLLHNEHRQAQEEKKRLMAKAIEDAAVVREGDLKWLGKLYNVLIDAGIPCTVISDAGCKKGCCGNKCRLIVSKEDLERAQERVTEYYMEIHPGNSGLPTNWSARANARPVVPPWAPVTLSAPIAA
jgi:hypothetical protein